MWFITLSLLATLDGGAVEAAWAPDAGLLNEALSPPETSQADGDESPADAEMEAMRALEEASLDGAAKSDAALRETVASLPLGSALRLRLEAALEQAELSGETLPALAPVTDVLTFDISSVASTYDIPIEMQPLVAQYVHFFQGSGRKWFRKWMSRSSRYIPLMQPILEGMGLPRDLVYLSMIESGFNTQAKSWAKAVGPWQFIPGTAKLFKLHEDFWVDERRDPIKATYAAGAFLRLLHNVLGHWYLAWAGYNTGGVRVRQLIEKHGTRDFWELSAKKKGLAKETQHYVPKLIACALVAKHPEAFGFTRDEFDFEPLFEFDEVTLTDAVDLEVVAQAAGTDLATIAMLNPELKRSSTPPSTAEKPYHLRIPKGQREQFASSLQTVLEQERLKYRIHIVVAGDTLSRIAAKYQSATEAIMRVNQMTKGTALKVGTELAIPMAAAPTGNETAAAMERQVAGLRAAKPEDEVPAGIEKTAPKSVGKFSVDQAEGKKKVAYVISKGDSLWSIARRFDVHVADLRSWNDDVGSTRGLRVGRALVIYPGAAADLTGSSAPAPNAPVASAPAVKPPRSAPPMVASGGVHVVERGDSLWSIGQKYGVSIDALKSLNGLANNRLKTGQRLRLAGP
jgi:membrane-bound lytic murein transglycosylase D